MKPDQPREDVPAYSGAVDLVDLGQEEQRRFEPPNGAQSKWPKHELPLPIIMEPCSPVRGATAHSLGPGAGRHRLGVVDPTYPGLAQRQQNAGIKTHTRVEGVQASRAQLDRCKGLGHSLSPTHMKMICQKKLTRSSGETTGRAWWTGAELLSPKRCGDGHCGTSAEGY